MWYRTYRPQTISELNLPASREALGRIRDSGSFSHAYLFAGSKGTGKTSSARILAKVLNCEKNEKFVKKALKSADHKAGHAFGEPCGACPRCLAITRGNSFCVTELDAASNRGIDDIRALRERVYLAPSDGLVSVYIIDEVHMLTTEAFNALLKVLEEPPAHVVFVLATTELHKVPETIISRCVLVQFQRALPEHIVSALQHIVDVEHITAGESVLMDIAKRAEGSFRDAVKLLEHVAQGKTKISIDDLKTSDGADSAVAKQLIEAITKRDAQAVSTVFQVAQQNDRDLSYVQKTVLAMMHEEMVRAVEEKVLEKSRVYQHILAVLNVSPDALLPFPYLPFELACLSLCLEGGGGEHIVEEEGHEHVEKPREKNPTSTSTPTLASPSPTVEPPPKQTEEPLTGSLNFEVLQLNWPIVLKAIKQTNATVEALLRATRPMETNGSAVTIEVFYPFHKEQLEQEKHRHILEKVIRETCGVSKATLKFVLGKKKPKEPVAEKKEEDAKLVQAAEEVFAG